MVKKPHTLFLESSMSEDSDGDGSLTSEEIEESQRDYEGSGK